MKTKVLAKIMLQMELDIDSEEYLYDYNLETLEDIMQWELSENDIVDTICLTFGEYVEGSFTWKEIPNKGEKK